MKKMKILLAFTLFLMMFSNIGLANKSHNKKTAAANHTSCKSDREKFCNQQPTTPKAADCLAEHQDELSEGCKINFIEEPIKASAAPKRASK